MAPSTSGLDRTHYQVQGGFILKCVRPQNFVLVAFRPQQAFMKCVTLILALELMAGVASNAPKYTALNDGNGLEKPSRHRPRACPPVKRSVIILVGFHWLDPMGWLAFQCALFHLNRYDDVVAHRITSTNRRWRWQSRCVVRGRWAFDKTRRQISSWSLPKQERKFN